MSGIKKIDRGQMTEKENKMVEENLGLVYRVLYKYWYKQSKEIQEDLLQEGCIGLCVATKLYDKTMGKFSTYANFYIDGYMKRYFTYNESSELKVTEDTYRDARENRAIRLDKPILNVGESEIGSLYDLIPSENDTLDKFTLDYASRQELEYVCRFISKDDMEFALKYMSSKRPPATNKEAYKNYKKYDTILRKIRMYNTDYKRGEK